MRYGRRARSSSSYTSIPGVPHTNRIAENRVDKHMIRGIRSMLLSAGLPNRDLPFTAKCYALMRTAIKNGDQSIYARRHGLGHFDGPLIPGGALARAMPSAIHHTRRAHFGHTMQPTIFSDVLYSRVQVTSRVSLRFLGRHRRHVLLQQSVRV